MATPKQIAANRKNALNSTGPKSAETKAKVSQNGLKHGLCRSFRVLPEVEHQEDYDALLNQLMEAEQPVDRAEIELVVKMAQHTWLANRAVGLQNNCFSLEPKTPQDRKTGEIPVAIELQLLERYARYHAAQDRAYQRASAELQKRKKERRLAEIGFASQKRAAEKHALQMAIANMRKQREEMKLGSELADMLPPDFNLSDLNSPSFRAISEAMGAHSHPHSDIG